MDGAELAGAEGCSVRREQDGEKMEGEGRKLLRESGNFFFFFFFKGSGREEIEVRRRPNKIEQDLDLFLLGQRLYYS